MAYVLFSAMRNESPFLLDWIAYHRAIGFDKICIVSNNCDDGSDGLLAKLAAQDIIVHLDQVVPDGMSPQASAVAHAERMGLLRDGDWGIFLDADEYLNIHAGAGRVSDLAEAVAQIGATGILIAWRLFGDSGHKRFPGSYLRADYTGCEVRPNSTQFKTFFRKGNVAAGFSPLLHRCRLHPKAGVAADFVTGAGTPITVGRETKVSRRHSAWLENGEQAFAFLKGSEVDYTIAQINHYIVRDPHSFALKKMRGRGHVSTKATNRRHTAKFYQAGNHNIANDNTILRWQELVEAKKVEITMKCDLTPELSVIEEIYARAAPAEEDLAGIENSVGKTVFPLTFPGPVADYVRGCYARAEMIIEYGSGGSTLLAAELGVPCLAVESDQNWATSLTTHLDTQIGPGGPAKVLHVDIGATGNWGYPVDASHWGAYWRYPLQVWQDNPKPNPSLILIDGRLRKACFAAALLNVTRETTLLFDDYTTRPHYHDVEEYVKPTRVIGRMAEFVITPGMVDQAHFQRLVPWFFDLR